ncbi:alpha-galactosidase [Amycolatopsis regifaucium]|uniref:Alpha-galactosidase n=1 Tax=Amycolatopsis regifaucium TaxID=546365 RepID=A0A154MWL8_9PSEU|nr:alpha-galactosidase [Amycolatopsis regifaucium]KZB88692.1 alpha-galactosidase [Amycolatopsis regifaucium]OKA07136.1 alpha-galactosidase [Amycolatopsis regifaucium]SFI57042.1 alpha-galactosidase [Amycolatopsis regifaucium]
MTEIVFDDSTRSWLIRTVATSYALRLAEDDTPGHVHWGPPLTLEQLADVLPETKARWDSFNDPNEGLDELAADGGTRHWTPALQIRFADGTRALEWRYLSHDIDGGLLKVHFRDRHYPLRITLGYRVPSGTDVVERWTELTHDGADDPIEVIRADSASWVVPVRPDYRISHVTGRWAAESQLLREPVPHGETTFGSRRGITSHHANPWVMIDDGEATERYGEVYSAALAWSGSWRITTTRSSTGRLTVTGGFGQDGVVHRLAPRDTLTTPVFAGLYSEGGFGAASRAWHAYTLGHVLPRPGELRPVLYNSWEATGFDVTEAGQRALAEKAAALGVELFVMDDGWFGARSDDRAGLGDWSVNHDKFPDGLKPLIDEVRRLGMKFGIWVEPEMVNPDSALYRERPDWVLHHPHRTRSELRNQLVLNFARPDVAEWAFGWLDALVGEHGIDFLKWDMNRPFTEAGWPAESAPDRLWVEHTRAVYAIMDRLRAGHPGLRIEACSGGGGRIDFGVMARTDQVWTSDNTDALDRLVIQHGYGQVYPTRAMSAWVTDDPNFVTQRSTPLRFRFHVAMAGVLGIGGDIVKWPDEALAYAREQIALYKEIRPVVQHGRLYRLVPPSTDGVSALQYVAADGGRAVVFVFRQAAHFHAPERPVRLDGLDSAGRYRDEDTGKVWHGAALQAHGLFPGLPAGDFASTVIRLTKL